MLFILVLNDYCLFICANWLAKFVTIELRFELFDFSDPIWTAWLFKIGL